MQENIQTYNLKYFNIYTLFFKLKSLLILTCLFVSCNQKQPKQDFTLQNRKISAESAININIASIKDLERLPRIGTKTAQKIIEHREKYGRFRKPEHLMLVKGISDRRFREIRDLIKTE